MESANRMTWKSLQCKGLSLSNKLCDIVGTGVILEAYQQTTSKELTVNTTYTAYTASELFNAGYSCDGHPFIAEQSYVMIENEAGRRFRHTAIFNGTQEVVCEESGDSYFPDLRQEATAKAERLAARVNAAFAAGKDVDWTYWGEVDPAYGSDEYVSQGTEAKRVFDEKAAA
jgi:hypothetical protein